jgi:hypothetical protein
MKLTIRKYKSWNEVMAASSGNLSAKSDEERLAAMTVLAERLSFVNPKLNADARSLPSIYPIVKRRGR